MPLLLTILLVWAAIVLLVLTLCLAAARGSGAHAPSVPEHESLTHRSLGGESRGGEAFCEPPTTTLAEATAHPRAGA